MEKEGHIYARPDRFRAAMALIAPIFVLVVGGGALLKKGYSLADYPLLIASGEVSSISQIVGWVCFALWIYRFWPSAIDALSSNFVLARNARLIMNAKGHEVALSSIEKVRLDQTFLRKEIVIEAGGRAALRQGVIFAQSSAQELLAMIRTDVTRSA